MSPDADLKPRGRAALTPLDLFSVTLSGEFGRRLEKLADAILEEVDIDKVFLADFRVRESHGGVADGNAADGYTGLGKFLDTLVRLAAAGDPRMVELKRKTIAALIATQDSDGYIGAVRDPDQRAKVLWDVHEAAYLIWGLVSDYQLCGESDSLNAARRLADFFVERLTSDPTLRGPQPPYDFPFEVASLGLDRALLALGRASGQPRYQRFVVDVLRLADYDPSIECGTGAVRNHAYTHMSRCLAQLDLYRDGGDVRLLRPTRKTIEFLRRQDGLLVTGSCSHWECWHATQSGVENTSASFV